MTDIVETEIPKAVESCLATEFQPTTRWGEAKGEPTTLRAMIGTRILEWRDEQVMNPANPSHSRDRTTRTRVEWAIRSAVRDAFGAHLKTTAADLAQQIKAQLSDKVSTDVAATLRKMLGL